MFQEECFRCLGHKIARLFDMFYFLFGFMYMLYLIKIFFLPRLPHDEEFWKSDSK